MDETSGIALDLETGVPSYQVEDEEGRIHLLIHFPIEDGEHRWCLWLKANYQPELDFHLRLRARTIGTVAAI
jgi:hypothetical protein